MRWVYAGELGAGDQLNWGMPPGGNIPKSGLVPDLHDTGLYLHIRQLARAGLYEGCDPDFDASAIKVTGVELMDLLRHHYGDLSTAAPQGDLAEYVALARRLGEGKRIALVAVAM